MTAYRVHKSVVERSCDLDGLRALDPVAFGDGIAPMIRRIIDDGPDALGRWALGENLRCLVAAYAVMAYHTAMEREHGHRQPLESVRAADIRYASDIVGVRGWIEVPHELEERIKIFARGEVPEQYVTAVREAFAARAARAAQAGPVSLATADGHGPATDGGAQPDNPLDAGTVLPGAESGPQVTDGQAGPNPEQGALLPSAPGPESRAAAALPDPGDSACAGETRPQARDTTATAGAGPASSPAASDESAGARSDSPIGQPAPPPRRPGPKPAPVAVAETNPDATTDASPVETQEPAPPRTQILRWPASTSLTDEQIAARVETIGASEIGVPLGLSTWTTPGELRRRKREGAQSPSSHAMDAGNILEFAVLAEAARRNPGLRFVVGPGSLRIPGSRVSATPDAYALLLEDAPEALADVGSYAHANGAPRPPRRPCIVVDAKAPDDTAWWDEHADETGGLPRVYWAQVQIQMHAVVTNGGTVLYGLVVAHSRVGGWRQVRVDYDAAWCETACATATAWYERHVVEGVPCELSGDRDADAWATTERADGTDYLEVAEDDTATLKLVDYYRRGDARVRDWSARMEKLKAALRSRIGPAKGLRLPTGDKVAAVGSGTGTRVDWQRIAEQLGTRVPEAEFAELRERYSETSDRARGIRGYWKE